jgi:hypothetical protein
MLSSYHKSVSENVRCRVFQVERATLGYRFVDAWVQKLDCFQWCVGDCCCHRHSSSWCDWGSLLRLQVRLVQQTVQVQQR